MFVFHFVVVVYPVILSTFITVSYRIEFIKVLGILFGLTFGPRPTAPELQSITVVVVVYARY